MDHIPAPPPPLHAYWFYTSSLALDDPLSPLPTTAAQNTKQPPRPFAKYDSTALEAAYQDLLREHNARDKENSNKTTPKTSSRSGSPTRERIKRMESSLSKEAALEGHPVWNSEDDELQLRDEITSTTAPESSPIDRRSTVFSGSRFAPSSAPTAGSNVSSFTACIETNAANMATTRNPFIRSLSLSRAATMPQNTSANSSRRSSMTGKKPPSSPAPPVEQKEIPVGIQRLHKVLLPSFIMTPIYWSPLQDVSSVVRGTWFYKDTMLPVETEIANRLETGWEEVHAWTEEWELELASAVEVGREGEEKVRWQLWDKSSISVPNSRPGSSGVLIDGAMLESATMPTSATKTVPATSSINDPTSRAKPNEWDWVLFANGKDAYICRDSMLSFGQKRPLANIRRGKTVGTHVVRGFSETEWLKLHPPRKRPQQTTAKSRSSSATISPVPRNVVEKNARGYPISPGVVRDPPPTTVHNEFQAGGDVGGFTQQTEEGLGLGENEEQRGKVTDLFLVIHGIGQKLSERVESFHFTHYINAFRRTLNQELRSEAVRPLLREGVGVMVLPVNWRHNLTFEGIEESFSEDADSESKTTFTLNDITPMGIPAVRNLIGDVMLDIPYYLSHHKEKMVKAVICEANRVYRLWCKNNPGFEKEGRVHIIAHSLGTALAMDILSKQPTHTVYDPTPPPPQSSGSGRGKRRNKESAIIQDEHFDFDTTNIFFCGSPAGFFLLLNRSGLLPRKGRRKPGSFGEDKEPGVAGEAGRLGCMAVDNVYNVLHFSDPIAYRLNPTVDTEYAATLKTAFVPSTSVSFFDAISSTLRSVLPTSAAPDQHPTFTRLPSNIELETHDFSREELAEKRLYLLNDNGQLDWYLNISNPLENQYLNMLGAHSSYLASRDFARMLVVEVGRPVGRKGTLRAMRVQKKRGFLFK
ncbi:DDHD domain protein [Sphaerosporella brunnea]|uniref:DDHD domain protein n=1 Tax=Sphaerosporella brunnea TaxID=1250544 RepID=A0A5J5F0W9_9PEZI|nr:DDHD domain protein [Sphaerosporella brunnea]